MSSEKGFFAAIFDLSFSEFVTIKIIKFLFALAIIASAVMTIILIVGGFATESIAVGVMFLILSPIIFFLYVLMARVWLELIIVVFKIAENTSRLVEENEPSGPAVE